MEGSYGSVRRASEDDLQSILEIAASRRRDYSQHQPVMWRESADSREVQERFFRGLLNSENHFFFVSEDNGELVGFVIATIQDAPPVYAPGGKTAVVDDFAVSSPERWGGAGGGLLSAVIEKSRGIGVAQIIVVCGHHDEPKRSVLKDLGLKIASEWWTAPL